MSPEDALAYMKGTPDLVIVDVATTSRYEKNHFEGAISIPIKKLDSEEEYVLYMGILAGHPVLFHAVSVWWFPVIMSAFWNCVMIYRKLPISMAIRCLTNRMYGFPVRRAIRDLYCKENQREAFL